MCSKNASQLLIRLGFPVIALLSLWILEKHDVWNCFKLYAALLQMYNTKWYMIYLQEESSLYLSESALFIMYMLSGGT